MGEGGRKGEGKEKLRGTMLCRGKSINRWGLFSSSLWTTGIKLRSTD